MKNRADRIFGVTPMRKAGGGKRMAFFLLSLVLLAATCSGCAGKYDNRTASHPSEEDGKRIPFNPDEGLILFSIQFNDSITGELFLFDTGMPKKHGEIMLDSSFSAMNLSFMLENNPDSTARGSVTSWRKQIANWYFYNKPLSAKIGRYDLKYNRFKVENFRIASQSINGIFNIPPEDTTHVWEFNFENDYLEIHSADSFKIPEEWFVFPVKDGRNPFNIQIPMRITCSDGDTISVNKTFMVDMALADDFALVSGSDEYDFFEKKKDAVWLSDLSGIIKSHTVSVLLNGLDLDSVRIYSYPREDYPLLSEYYLVGLNFLKRFNVFFDKKNNLIGLQPLKNYRRIVLPVQRFHFLSSPSAEGKHVVKIIADSENNYYWTGGLRVGDEITMINGVNMKDVTRNDQFDGCDTLFYDVIRNGKPLRLVIPVDKNEKKGE